MIINLLSQSTQRIDSLGDLCERKFFLHEEKSKIPKMFTGIIESLGTIKAIESGGEGKVGRGREEKENP